MGLTVIIDMDDSFRDFLKDIEDRADIKNLDAILIAHMKPIVDKEKSILSDHSKSGALAGSLEPRVGTGDRPGTISVFSAPTARKKFLREHWGRGRRQQQGWALHPKYQGNKGGRMGIFYAPFVELGHRQVRRNAEGQLAEVADPTQAVMFAHGAMEELGDQQAEALGDAVLTYICGG